MNSDFDKPMCVSECGKNEYIDENTIDGVSLCVSSCKHLKPLAYVVNNKYCAVNCSKIEGY